MDRLNKRKGGKEGRRELINIQSKETNVISERKTKTGGQRSLFLSLPLLRMQRENERELLI